MGIMNKYITFIILCYCNSFSYSSYSTDYVCCQDTCISHDTNIDFSQDEDCDDGGENSDFSFCDLGLDCSDCGPRLCYPPPSLFLPSFPPSSPPDSSSTFSKYIDSACQLSNKKAKKCNIKCSKKCIKKNCCTL